MIRVRYFLMAPHPDEGGDRDLMREGTLPALPPVYEGEPCVQINDFLYYVTDCNVRDGDPVAEIRLQLYGDAAVADETREAHLAAGWVWADPRA